MAAAAASSSSRQWSTELFSADYRDLQASAMGLNHDGRVAVLGGKKGMVVATVKDDDSIGINLHGLDIFHRENFLVSELSKRLSRTNNTKWDLTKISWNPSSSFHHLVAFAAHDRLELAHLRGDFTLSHFRDAKAHSRDLTDVCWCPEDPNVLATASLDTFVNVWDQREKKNIPVVTINAMDSTGHVRNSDIFSNLKFPNPVIFSQCQWNRHSRPVIATSHGAGEVKLWDVRSPELPTDYIIAHQSRILSLDWSQNKPGQFVTSGQDCSIKLFETSADGVGKPKQTMKTAVPVWKAR